MNTCQHCGASFTPSRTHKNQRFCGVACAQRARRAREKLTRDRKVCPWCQGEFPDTHALRKYCSKACSYQAARERTPSRWKHIANRYGLTPAEFESMLEAQGGACAICEAVLDGAGPDKNAPNVDHDHETGEVRAILCRPCNIALGHLRDDPVIVESALNYLLRWKGASARTP